MRLIVGTLAAAAIAVASPALAQAQAGINVGMKITDASGGAVGTVSGIKGDNILVKTDKHEVLLPKSSFTVGQGKLLFGMTQAQLDAEIEKTAAAASAAIATGATVKSVDRAAVGTIESVADGKVTIALSGGQKIQVEQSGVRGNADGTVTVGLTSTQLQAQVQAQPAAPAAVDAAAPSSTSGN